MNVNLTDLIFHDEDKAREHFERLGWPDGPFCPHCGEVDKVYRLHGQSHRPGLHHCNSCNGAFTIMTGGVMESSHLPLTKWALGFHLMASSKKGVSAKQLQRQLGIGYRAAWFLAHRIRKAMAPADGGKLGGEGKTLESDETFVGGKAKNAHKGKPVPVKRPVHALVERRGRISASHVADVTAKTLRAALDKSADRKSMLNTDDRLRTCRSARASRGIAPSPIPLASTFPRTARPIRRRLRASLRCSSAASWVRSTASRNSTCSATATSSRSAGTPVRRSELRTPSALALRSRAPAASV